VLVVATKEDKIAKAHRIQAHRVLSQALDNTTVIGTSAAKSQGVENLWSALWPLLEDAQQVADT
jgi:selenocysteine-specific translation elongation factor